MPGYLLDFVMGAMGVRVVYGQKEGKGDGDGRSRSRSRGRGSVQLRNNF